MGLREWFKREWHVVEGHAKWDFYKWVFGLAGASVLALGAYLVHKLKYGPDWLPYAVVFVLALFILFWAGNRMTPISPPSKVTQSTKEPAAIAPVEVEAKDDVRANPNDPDLRAKIEEVLFFLKRETITNDVFVLMRVSIVNHGESEAVVTKWELSLEVGGVRIKFDEQYIPAEWKIRRFHQVPRGVVVTDDIDRDTSSFKEPLRKGVPKERWVCFCHCFMDRILPPHNARIILTLTDAFGRTHVTEAGPGFTHDLGEIVKDIELPRSPVSSPALAESVIEKVEKVGKLRSLAGRADFLRDYLEEVWHLFLKEKKTMPNPIGVRSMPDKIEEWTDIQLWRFRLRFQDYTGGVKEVDPECKSDLVKDGFPHEGEDYLSVERKIKEHADTLRKRADGLLAEAKKEYAVGTR